MRPASRMTEKIVAERLVFVDECGTHTSLTLLYGHAPGDERLRLSGPRKGQEHHFALDYEYGGVRIISDSGRSDHCFGLRGLRRVGARSEPANLLAYSLHSSSNHQVSRVRFLSMGVAATFAQPLSSLSFLRSYKDVDSMVRWLGIPETIHTPQHTQMETFYQEPCDEQKIGRIAD